MIESCEKCLLPLERCICSHIKSIDTRLRILVLQHPQEPGHELGTAQITQLSLPKAQIRTGLSWANLKAALGDSTAQPARWAVLYLGSGVKSETPDRSDATLQFVSRKGSPVSAPPIHEIDGLVVLDGTWSQAKSLWWRNAWLLKLKRAILNPKEKSLYGKLRKEPRKECLSTVESVAEALIALGEPQQVSEQLKEIFKVLLAANTKKHPAKRNEENPQSQN